MTSERMTKVRVECRRSALERCSFGVVLLRYLGGFAALLSGRRVSPTIQTDSVLDWLPVRVESKLVALHHFTLHPCPLPYVPRMYQRHSHQHRDLLLLQAWQLHTSTRTSSEAKLGMACREKATPTSPSSTGAQFLISIVGIWGYFQDNRSHSAW